MEHESELGETPENFDETRQEHQDKVERVGERLAAYAIWRAVNKPVEVHMIARAGHFPFGRSFFINQNPAVYGVANNILKKRGLSVHKIDEQVIVPRILGGSAMKQDVVKLSRLGVWH